MSCTEFRARRALKRPCRLCTSTPIVHNVAGSLNTAGCTKVASYTQIVVKDMRCVRSATQKRSREKTRYGGWIIAMTTLRRWNYNKQTYESYNAPNELKVKSYSDDMDEIISCALCGRPVRFGDCYTSKEIHTPHGFGYAVCGDCYFGERVREEEWRRSGRKE